MQTETDDRRPIKGWTEFTASEQLMYLTVRIGVNYPDGRQGSGTGFFFELNVDEKRVGLLITNKHVVKGISDGYCVFHRSGKDGEIEFPLGMFKTLTFQEDDWISHPDPDVDLCAFSLAEISNKSENDGERLFIPYLNQELATFPSEQGEIDALEEILMIGYPSGIWDSKNNRPIFRRGITATDPKLDYEGKKEFLIDAACFPGSSGSPVVLFSKGPYAIGKRAYVGTRLVLLGILFAGPQHTVSGEIRVVDIPTIATPQAISRIPINLGYVIKAERLFNFIDVFRKLIEKEESS